MWAGIFTGLQRCLGHLNRKYLGMSSGSTTSSGSLLLCALGGRRQHLQFLSAFHTCGESDGVLAPGIALAVAGI